MIEITDRAAAELKSLFEKEGIEQPAIRIYVTESGADIHYGLALADDITENDAIMENNGIKIVMSSFVEAGFTDGSIDFRADSKGKNFIIQNANSGICSSYEAGYICAAE
ncbi:HesB/IscA family protein [Methanosarcina sp. T3]|uniref:HesB/IscA family protein n=1 Tax=Methanosarcina sp. T3 TaxID=3439062 RepID=UPI003F84F834